MDLVNAPITRLFDLLLMPFRNLAPIWGLIFISLVSGIFFVWLFGLVSNQAAIRIIRDRIRGNLIGVRLFQSDVGVVLRLQGRIFFDTLNYMRYSLIPMLVLLIPAVLIMAQLNLRYQSAPLRPGQTAMVKVTMDDANALHDRLRLEVPAGVAVETPGVHVPALNEVSWRISAIEPGVQSLVVHAAGASAEKRVVVGDSVGKVPSLRSGGFFDLLLFPGEPALGGDSPLRSIAIDYPDLEMKAFGLTVHWLVGFLVLSIAFGFLFKDALGVEI